jgi:hypothetical protein
MPAITIGLLPFVVLKAANRSCFGMAVPSAEGWMKKFTTALPPEMLLI